MKTIPLLNQIEKNTDFTIDYDDTKKFYDAKNWNNGDVLYVVPNEELADILLENLHNNKTIGIRNIVLIGHIFPELKSEQFDQLSVALSMCDQHVNKVFTNDLIYRNSANIASFPYYETNKKYGEKKIRFYH